MAWPENIRLGDLLVQQGLLNSEQPAIALAEQKRSGRKLGRIVAERGFVTEEAIAQALARQAKVPYVDLRHFSPKPELIRLLPEAQARRLRAIVLDEIDGRLRVGFVDPGDLAAYDDMQRVLRRDIDVAAVAESQLLALVDRIYRRTEEISGLAKELTADLADVPIEFGETAKPNGEIEEAPVANLLQTVFEEGIRTRASDSAWLSSLARGSGNLGQTNHLADYLWLGIASAIYLHVEGRLGRLPFLASLVALLAAASLTGSRSVLVYAAGFALLAFWSSRHIRHSALGRVAHIALWLLPATLALQWVFAHFDLGGALQAQVAGERLVREVSGASPRLQLWRTGLAIFAAHPWLGAGIGQFPILSYSLVAAGPDGAYLCGEHAHNLLIHLLAEFGALAPLFAVLLGLRWWLAFVRQPWSAAHWWIAALLLVLAAHSQLEYPLWYAFFLGIAALVLGAWTLFSLAGDYRQLERALRSAAARTSEAPAGSERLEALARLRRESLFTHYVESIYAFQLRVNKEALPQKIAVASAAMRFSPVDRIALNRAYLLALDQRPAEAQAALGAALANSPGARPAVVAELEALGAAFPECAALRETLRSFPAAH